MISLFEAIHTIITLTYIYCDYYYFLIRTSALGDHPLEKLFDLLTLALSSQTRPRAFAYEAITSFFSNNKYNIHFFLIGKLVLIA